jgi:hypothetical protein
VPGLAHTGPYNPHFVADIGAAWLRASPCSHARGVRATGPRRWAGAGFLAAHALIHVIDLTMQRSGEPIVDIGLVIVPAALAVWAALPEKDEA